MSMTGKGTALPGCEGETNQRHAVRRTCALEIGPLTLADLAAVMALEKVSFPSPGRSPPTTAS